jgi:hypothetical protein
MPPVKSMSEGVAVLEHVVRLERMRVLRAILPILSRIEELCTGSKNEANMCRLLRDAKALLATF